jgi:glycosyltransferase involved in cell wall biosynthesis
VKKILINAANLHTGGGVQVAVSFISEFSDNFKNLLPHNISVYVSSEVNNELILSGFNPESIKNYVVFDVYGISALKNINMQRYYGFDLVFSIFGPLYLPRFIKNHIIGFAQLWIIYPNNSTSKKMPVKSQLVLRIKFLIQWIFFKFSASLLVVESKHVKDRLIDFKNYPAEHIEVVSNCVSALYFDASTWLPLPAVIGLPSDVIKIGYVSRSYPHKNLHLLIDVAHELIKISNFRFQFFVTLNEDEWATFSPEYQAIIANIGPLTVTQCPTFYQAMNGVIFTSLLECFSATPLEAMVMQRPLFASERNFVRDCCAEHAIYIDPLDSKDIAEKIHAWFVVKPAQEKAMHIEQAYQHVLTLPNSKDRALGYINIINQQLNRTKV